jgi:hypothetical protein
MHENLHAPKPSGEQSQDTSEAPPRDPTTEPAPPGDPTTEAAEAQVDPSDDELDPNDDEPNPHTDPTADSMSDPQAEPIDGEHLG